MKVVVLHFMANPFETSSLKAWADVQLQESGHALLSLHGLKLIRHRDGHMTVKMPSLRQGNSFKTLCHIDSMALYREIEQLLINQWYEVNR